GKEYGIICLTNQTAFVDISEPTDPKYLGSLPTQTGNNAWRDAKTYNNHVFIVADFNDNHGMQVFDLTQLRTVDPNNPQTFSNSALYTGVDSAHNIAINEDSGFAYIMGSNRAAGGLHVVNIQNPTSPFQAGNFGSDGYTHDAQIVNYSGPDSQYTGQEIAFCCNTDSLTIVDTTNKSNMNQISRTEYSQTGYTHQCWLTEDQRLLYLGDEIDEMNFGGGTRILVWNVEDLDNPQFLGRYIGETNATDHNLYIKGNRLYLANYTEGLRVYEIDPTNPLGLDEIAWVDTYPTGNSNELQGAWSNYPFFESGSIVISDRQNGMFVVRLSEIEFEFPSGRPETINPSGLAEFQVQVTDALGTAAPGTGVLHVDRGNGFETFAMNSISNNFYEAIFPSNECGSTVRYFVSAMTDEGVEITSPSNAPNSFFSATSADAITATFDDNFQTNQGWAVSGDAGDGQWERGLPAGDGDRGDPSFDGDGSGACFLTDNEAGNSDVDGGTTILTSPTMDAIGSGNGVASFISYYRWYSNNIGGSPFADIMEVEISNNNGASWIDLETVGPDGPDVIGGWVFKSFNIADIITPTDQMRIRFVVSDLGDGSVVEAAVDGVRIELIECDSVLLGDVNQDGVVNLLDVQPFVELISSGEYLAEADMNGDGSVNLLDVELFVAAISG
ncbi:MAG: choice-of-anchor B family protein, partial [Planctomycetota bacterium]